MAKLAKEAVIVAYGRSPMTKARKGSFASTHPVDYAAETLKGVLQKVPQLDPSEIDDVIVGCAITSGVQGGNVGRLIAQRAGLPDVVPGLTVNRFCSSGLQTVAYAANAIIADQADVIVAGGVESMSMTSMGGDPTSRDKWLTENRPGVYTPMGITAENVAAKYGIGKTEMEQLAVESHAKAAAAQQTHAYDREIIPIPVTDDQGNISIVTKDEGIRASTSLESLGALKPAFRENGVVTAGTSSQTTDGAAFVVLMSSEKAEELKIRPIARFIAFTVAGVPGEIMGIGPMVAVPKLLKRTGFSIDDMDVIEINEAFSAQAIPCIRTLGFDMKKINPRGGALALGHPLGATGAILVSKALSYLEDTNGRYALITMCIGGGMGAAGIIEKL